MLRSIHIDHTIFFQNKEGNKMIQKQTEVFCKEAKTAEEANGIDLDKYRFERFSESKGVYIFVKRKDK